MKIYIGDLRKGDIIIMSGGKSASSSLFSHAAIIAQIHDGTRPYLLEITGYGFERHLYCPNANCDYVYRLKSFDAEQVAGRAASIGNIWATSYQDTKYENRFDLVNTNIYSTSSIFTSYFGDSSYGAKAMDYNDYLYTHCQCNPPRELQRSAKKFSGTICTFLPIALYQTALGIVNSLAYMKLDARKSLPRDLANYLDKNEFWVCLGTVRDSPPVSA